MTWMFTWRIVNEYARPHGCWHGQSDGGHEEKDDQEVGDVLAVLDGVAGSWKWVPKMISGRAFEKKWIVTKK